MNKYEQFQEAMRTIQARRAAATALAERSAFSARESWPGIEAAGVPARRE